MPQMFPMSWLFIYFYVVLSLVVVIVLVSFCEDLVKMSGGSELSNAEELGWSW
nr:ATP synthase F0 subunit 8 [Polydesmus sp. GZCS-2019]